MVLDPFKALVRIIRGATESPTLQKSTRETREREMPNAPELVFPWVVPTNTDLTCFEGPIACAGDSISGLWLRLEKIPQNSSTLEGAVLRCSQELGLALSGQEHIIKVHAFLAPFLCSPPCVMQPQHLPCESTADAKL